VIDEPVLRVLILRLFGLVVGVALALVAIGLVAYGIDHPLGWLRNGLTSFATWVSTDPSLGVAVLVGVGLVVLAILAALVMVPSRPPGLHRLEQTKTGTTWVDLSSVAGILERSLRDDVDSKIGVRAQKSRLRIVTPARPEAPFAVADRVGDTAQRELGIMGLSNVEYVVTVGPEAPTKKQPRVQ
jgi:hypothetical protein